MSRLDSMLRRFTAQRDGLNWATSAIAGIDGDVLDMGLGNGRTYHHMKHNIKDRDLYVFERAVASHPDSTPPEELTILGDVRETLPAALTRFGATASLIHADLGGHNRAKNDNFARLISPLVEPLLAIGGMMVSSDRMYFEALTEMPLPPQAVEGRCFIYRRDS